MRPDLAVLGAGPAGATAALVAAGHGLSVVLIDENGAAGGQVWRAPAPHLDGGGEARQGGALRAALAASPVVHRARATAWMIAREGEAWRVDLVREGRAETVTARGLVIATGAHERIIPFPGWTLPGVIGLAGATVLLKANGVLPGRRSVVAGAGPLLYLVAAALLKAGGTVAAVVDLAARRDWLAALPALAARPDLLRQGLLWRARLAASAVPVLARHAIAAAEGEKRLAAVLVAPVDAKGRLRPGAAARRIEADSLAVGHGLVPETAATRLLRLPHRYDAARGGWCAVRDVSLAAPAPALWLAGEVGGIGGAAVAELEGRMAGLAAAQALGAASTPAAAALASVVVALARARRAGAAMAAMMRPREGMVDDIAPGTIICRCEDVTRAELDAAIAAGARTLDQLKQWTRCGMGPCQGRMCGEAAGALLAAAVGGRERAGQWTGRPPLRPVAADALVGDFDYADIPIPAPAPP